MKIKLTYPVRSHELEELRPLYEEFKRTNTEIFSRWCELAADQRNYDPWPYAPISQAVRDFLRERVEYESEAALIGGYSDFGRLLYADLYL